MIIQIYLKYLAMISSQYYTGLQQDLGVMLAELLFVSIIIIVCVSIIITSKCFKLILLTISRQPS